MRLRESERPLFPPTLELVTAFTDALERELSGYTFAQMTDAEAIVRFAPDLPEFPKLYVRLTWAVLDEFRHDFEASISLKELEALSEEMPTEREVYFYHLARMMLSSLALGRVMDAAETKEA